MHHRIDHRQQLAHRGDQRDLRGFAGRAQALGEYPDHRVPSRGDQRGHVPHGAHGRATAPDRPVPPPPPTLAIEGGHAPQGRTLLPVEQTQLRQLSQPCAAHHRPNARHALQQLFPCAPHRTLLDQVIQVRIEPGQFLMQPAQVGRNPLPDSIRGAIQAMLFGSLHRQHLAAPRQQGRQLLCLGSGEHAQGRLNDLRKAGQHLRIERIRLGPRPRRLGKVPDLARIHHDHGPGRVHQCPHQESFQPSGGFHHDQGGVPLTQLREHRG